MFIYSEEVKIFLNITSSSEAVIEEYDYIKIKYFYAVKNRQKSTIIKSEANMEKKIMYHTFNRKCSHFSN